MWLRTPRSYTYKTLLNISFTLNSCDVRFFAGFFKHSLLLLCGKIFFFRFFFVCFAYNWTEEILYCWLCARLGNKLHKSRITVKLCWCLIEEKKNIRAMCSSRNTLRNSSAVIKSEKPNQIFLRRVPKGFQQWKVFISRPHSLVFRGSVRGQTQERRENVKQMRKR